MIIQSHKSHNQSPKNYIIEIEDDSLLILGINYNFETTVIHFLKLRYSCGS